MAHDASPSWSGFNYQGKVALFYVLSLFNDPAHIDTSCYELVLEHTEDFEIRIAGTTKSIHQVKAYQTGAFSSYSNALLGISLELQKNHSILGYVHTWKDINPKGGRTLAESVQITAKKLISEFLGSAEPAETLIGKSLSDKNTIPKTSAIIRAALPGFNSQQILEFLERVSLDTNGATSRINSFTYPDGKTSCDLAVIDAHIYGELNKCLKQRGLDGTSAQIERLFHNFLGKLDEHIMQRHLNVSSGSPLTISFSEIDRALHVDLEAVSSEYLAHKFKHTFHKSLEEFFADPELYDEPDQDLIKPCNLRTAQKFLNGLPSDALWQLYCRCSPQIELNNIESLAKAFNVDLDGIKHVLFNIYLLIDPIHLDHSSREVMIYKRAAPSVDRYLPTTIRSDLPVTTIVKRILKNSRMIEVLFEIRNLIYNGQGTVELRKILQERTDLGEEVADDVEKRTEIMKCLRLMSADSAKAELC